MNLHGFQPTDSKGVFRLERGRLNALVSFTLGSWGYVLWLGNNVVAGEKNWNWDTERACEEASRAMRDATTKL